MTQDDSPPQILLVEDNSSHAELVRRCLEDSAQPHALIHVKDGRQALDYLTHAGRYADTAPARPALVLLDLRLPRVDGLEVLRHIKSTPRLETIPVVVLTTSEARRDLVDAYEHDVNAYVVKPDDYDELADLLSHTSAFWLTWNRTPR